MGLCGEWPLDVFGDNERLDDNLEEAGSCLGHPRRLAVGKQGTDFLRDTGRDCLVWK